MLLTLKEVFPSGSDGKESACNAGDQVLSLGWEDPLEKEIATHFSILAWRIPWTEMLGGLKPMGLQRVGHNWAANFQCQGNADFVCSTVSPWVCHNWYPAILCFFHGTCFQEWLVDPSPIADDSYFAPWHLALTDVFSENPRMPLVSYSTSTGRILWKSWKTELANSSCGGKVFYFLKKAFVNPLN